MECKGFHINEESKVKCNETLRKALNRGDKYGK
jgi:hypothetical protein